MSRSVSPSDAVPSAARGEKNLQIRHLGENLDHFPAGRHARAGAGLEGEGTDGRRGEPEALLLRRADSASGSLVRQDRFQKH